MMQLSSQREWTNVALRTELRCFLSQTRAAGGIVSAMDVTEKNTTLITADSMGFLFVWDIAQYCTHGREDNLPECESFHVQ